MNTQLETLPRTMPRTVPETRFGIAEEPVHKQAKVEDGSRNLGIFQRIHKIPNYQKESIHYEKETD